MTQHHMTPSQRRAVTAWGVDHEHTAEVRPYEGSYPRVVVVDRKSQQRAIVHVLTTMTFEQTRAALDTGLERAQARRADLP